MEDESTKLPAPTTESPQERLLDIWATPSPFRTAGEIVAVPEGWTLQQIVDHVFHTDQFPYKTYVWIDGDYIPRKMYPHIKPKQGASISVKYVPMGWFSDFKKSVFGGNILRTVLTIAVIGASFFLGPALGAALAPALSATAQAALGGFIISTVGNLLVNAIAPPGVPKIKGPNAAGGGRSPKESPTLFIEGARNQADQFGVIPVVLGTHKYVPKLAARNYTLPHGKDQYVYQLFCWGYGHLTLADEKIGETDISEFEDVTKEHILDGSSDGAIPIYSRDVFQEEFQVQLTSAGSWQTRTSQVNTTTLHVDITCPQGVVKFNDQGKRTNRSVTVEAEYAVAGSGTWTGTQTLTITEATAEAVRRLIKWENLAEGQYDVRVRRTTADTADTQTRDETWWTSLRSIGSDSPVNFPGLCLTAMSIRATDQLNGAVDQYSGVPSQWIQTWNGSDWNTVAKSSNPAALFRFVAMNSSEFSFIGANAAPLSEARVDLETIQEWYIYCNTQGFEYNGVIDYSATVREILSEIAAAGRASLTIKDGKWSVIVDKAQTVIAQHFTPANTWGFVCERTYVDIPDAFRVLFLNEEIGFLQDERLVYNDGYDEDNAEEIVGLELPGITNPDLIWRHAREHLATLTLRPRTMAFYMDYEFLNAPRGSRCKLAHDVINVGLKQGRISSITTDNDPPANAILDEDGDAFLGEEGGYLLGEEADSVTNITHIVLNEPVTMEAGTDYGVVIRTHENIEHVKQVVTVAGATNTLQFSTSFNLEDSGIEVDNIFMFGELGSETIDVIVKDVLPENEHTARVIVQDYNEGIYVASQGAIPPFTSGATFPPEMKQPLAPELVNIQSDESVQERHLDGSISNRVVIAMNNPNAIPVTPSITYRLAGTDTYKPAKVIQSSAEQIILEGFDIGLRYDIRIRYRHAGSNGLLSNALSFPLDINNYEFIGTSENPPDISNFRIQVLGSIAFLEWDPVNLVDFSHYVLKFSPATSGVTWNSAPLLKDNHTAERYQVAAQVGTYLVKAYDLSGNESANASLVVQTTISSAYNAVGLLTESPTFAGTKTNCQVNGTALELTDRSLGEGTYEFGNTIDLGDVYTSRVTARLQASGNNVDNVMSSWTSLSLITSLSGTDAGSWSIELEYRTTDDDPSGTPTWTAWKVFVSGDLTFRAAEFRLKLYTDLGAVTPSVTELEVQVDMDDRIVKYEDHTISAGGVTFTLSPGMKQLLVVHVTGQNMLQGDYWEVTNKSNAGAKVEFFNSAGVSVERTADVTFIGYGKVEV